MIRFLLSVALLCTLLSGGLGFFNRTKLNDLNNALTQVRQQAQKSENQLKEAQESLKQTQERLLTQERLTQEERDTRSAELNSTKAKLNQVTDQLTTRENENKALTAALTEAGRNLDQKQRAETDRQALAARLIQVQANLNELRLKARDGSGTPVELEGSILSINREAKALTVSLGKNVGLTPNTRLDVRQNGQTVGQLRVVSVESTTCVAEFVNSTTDNIGNVSVGDAVILTIR